MMRAVVLWLFLGVLVVLNAVLLLLPHSGPGAIGYTTAPPPRGEDTLAYSVDPSTGVIVFAPVAVEGNRR